MSNIENRTELLAQAEPSSKRMETIKDPGFHIGRIETRSLNEMERVGLKAQNGKNEKGDPGVLLNADGKFKAYFEDDRLNRTPIDGPIFVNKDTLELKVMGLKQDGFNNPNAPLRVFSYNRDGSVDQVVFEKPKNNSLDKKLLKLDEKSTNIILDNGKIIQLIEDSAEDGYKDGQYGYRAIIVDGKRYNVIPESIKRFRDGGTTISQYTGEGKVFELYEPTQFARGKKPTLTLK